MEHPANPGAASWFDLAELADLDIIRQGSRGLFAFSRIWGVAVELLVTPTRPSRPVSLLPVPMFFKGFGKTFKTENLSFFDLLKPFLGFVGTEKTLIKVF